MRLLRAIVTGAVLVANISFWGLLVFILSIGRLIPFSRGVVIALLEKVVESWAAGNEAIFALTNPSLEWRISAEGDLRLDRNYLVISNHISWLDIPVVQKALIDRIPFMRFFLKDELRWAPIVGLAAWALEMPFMKRYSAEYLERYPEKRGKDLETTRRATKNFGRKPSSIISYIEGTRFTEQKHRQQENRWNWLLTPKLGGIAYVIGVVGDRLDGLVDVTITYPARKRIFWKMLSGQLDWISVDVRLHEIPAEFRTGSMISEKEQRERFRDFIWDIWDEKDALISARINSVE